MLNFFGVILLLLEVGLVCNVMGASDTTTVVGSGVFLC